MIQSEALTLINYIRQQKYKPSDWEIQFMASIEQSNFPALTFKQHMALEKIYAKATGGGRYQRRSYV